jgi:transposase
MTSMTFAPVPAAAAVDYSSTLIVVVELSGTSWVVGAQVPGDVPGRKPKRTLEASLGALLSALAGHEARALAADHRIARRIVAFEAGYSGFWLARALRARGIEVYVIHPASVPVSRPGRRAKSDRIDVDLLMRTLLAWLRGEPRACSMVPIPDLAEEDARQAVREREDLVSKRTALTNQVKSLLVTQGITGYEPRRTGRYDRLAELRGPDGAPPPPLLLARIKRLLAQLDLLDQQIGVLEAERDAVPRRVEQARKAAAETAAKAAAPVVDPVAPDSAEAMITSLVKLRGVGIQSATVLAREAFVRPIGSGRALGAYAGLTGTPYSSGGQEREQGISKAGNRRLRAAMVELAWLWCRYQSDSALSRWYLERTRGVRGRMRKVMIVALARKLLVALWRYATRGVVPEGAAVAP